MKIGLFILGIIIYFFGLFLGFVYRDSGCGSCTDKLIPTPTLSVTYIPSYSKPSLEQCAVMGCSAGTTFPIFIDIYLLGLLVIVFGILKRTPTPGVRDL